MTGLPRWAERRLSDLATVIHHPEEQLPLPDPWDGTWTARCPGCGRDAVWQRKPTWPAASIRCTCPIPNRAQEEAA